MEEHKHEHHTETHKHPNPNMKLWIMAVAIGLLIVISGVQAVELVSLKNKLSEVEELGVSSKTVSTGSSNDLAENLNNLPSMVGGC